MCKKLDAETYPDRKVIQLSGQFVPVRLNGDKEGAPQNKKFGIQGFPTILFIDSTEHVVGTVSGFYPPALFVGEMQKVLTSVKDVARYERTLAQHPRDFEALAGMADAYYTRREPAKGKSKIIAAEAVRRGRHSDTLGRAYNAAAQKLTEAEDWKGGLDYLLHAEMVLENQEDLMITRYNIAVCYLNLNQPRKAIAPLETVLAWKSLPAHVREQVEAMLVDAKK